MRVLTGPTGLQASNNYFQQAFGSGVSHVVRPGSPVEPGPNITPDLSGSDAGIRATRPGMPGAAGSTPGGGGGFLGSPGIQGVNPFGGIQGVNPFGSAGHANQGLVNMLPVLLQYARRQFTNPWGGQ